MAEATHQEILQCSADQLKKAILDCESYPKFVSGIKSAKTLSANPQGRVVEFTLDLIKLIHYTIDLRENEWDVSWTLVDSDIFKKNNGGWSLKPLGEKSVEATYRIDIDFKIFVPGMITKKLAGSNLPQLFRQFESYAKGLAHGR